MVTQGSSLRNYGFDANGSQYEVRIKAIVNGTIYYSLARDGAVIDAEGRSEQNETEAHLVERLMRSVGV